MEKLWIKSSSLQQDYDPINVYSENVVVFIPHIWIVDSEMVLSREWEAVRRWILCYLFQKILQLTS